MPLIFRLVTRCCFFFFFHFFNFHPPPALLRMIRFDTYFSNGSKPPTSFDILWSWSPNSCLWKASVAVAWWPKHYVRLPGFDMAGTEHGAKGYLHWVVKCHGTWKKHQRVFRIQLLSLWMCWIFAGFGRDFVCVLEQDWLGKPVQYHCHNPCPLSIQQLGTWTDCSMDERRITSKDFRCRWFATMNTFYRGRIWNETCWSYKHSLATLLCP